MTKISSELFNLSGKVIVVTGGTGLLGSVYCEAFSRFGANVTLKSFQKKLMIFVKLNQ